MQSVNCEDMLAKIYRGIVAMLTSRAEPKHLADVISSTATIYDLDSGVKSAPALELNGSRLV